MGDQGQKDGWSYLTFACVCYAGLVLLVAALSYWSELQKLDRGAYSDQVPPTFYVELVTLPGSLVVAGQLADYPDRYDTDLYRRALSSRTAPLVLLGLGQATLVGVAGATAREVRSPRSRTGRSR